MRCLALPSQRAFGVPMAAYLEAHIEQGPILEATHHPIGIVSGIQGLRWFRVEVIGEEAHAGTTPRRIRKDALVAALRMVAALQALLYDEADVVRFTVGRFEVAPNSPNTVPGHVLFTIDLRHPEAQYSGASWRPDCSSVRVPRRMAERFRDRNLILVASDL